MATPIQKKLNQLTPERKKKIKQRANQLILEEFTLHDLRKALVLTQENIAKQLKIRQEGVSRLEKRSDLLLSTLRSYIKALGGDLKLVVEFPDRPTIMLQGLGEIIS